MNDQMQTEIDLLSTASKRAVLSEVDYLLVCLIEECSEIIKELSDIQHRASKALRFGLDNTVPEDNPLTMRDKLVSEIADFYAAVESLQEAGALPKIPDHFNNGAKQYRRAFAIALARELGKVE